MQQDHVRPARHDYLDAERLLEGAEIRVGARLIESIQYGNHPFGRRVLGVGAVQLAQLLRGVGRQAVFQGPPGCGEAGAGALGLCIPAASGPLRAWPEAGDDLANVFAGELNLAVGHRQKHAVALDPGGQLGLTAFGEIDQIGAGEWGEGEDGKQGDGGSGTGEARGTWGGDTSQAPTPPGPPFVRGGLSAGATLTLGVGGRGITQRVLEDLQEFHLQRHRPTPRSKLREMHRNRQGNSSFRTRLAPAVQGRSRLPLEVVRRVPGRRWSPRAVRTRRGDLMHTNGVSGADLGDRGERNVGSRYRPIWLHASGGLGDIFAALDTDLHRRVALKQIADAGTPGMPRAASGSSPKPRSPATWSIRASCPCMGWGLGRMGCPYYAMRFVKGETLSTAIHRFHSGLDVDFTGRQFRWLLQRFIDVCNPVAYAHSRGILHRDLKPSNIMLGPFGETLVMDWGVAKVMSGGAEPSATKSGDEPREPQDLDLHAAIAGDGVGTLDGHTVGTPAFMSPEQAAGRLESLGPASDVYSLGVTLYVLLTDQRPFSGETRADSAGLFSRAVFCRRAPGKPAVPTGLEAICLRAMALEPGDRYDFGAATGGGHRAVAGR